MEKTKINVKGMVCQGCENRVCNALQSVEGVEKVSASFKKEEVIIKSKNEINRELVKQKIEKLGFQVV